MLAFMVPALIKLGAKFQAVQGELQSLKLQISSLEKGLQELKADLAATAIARKEIWSEVNNIRERTARLSTMVQLQTNEGAKCQPK